MKNIIFPSISKKAFTLAEVLIALTVIGIVAAITIPSILLSIQKKDLEARFKKANSAVFQVTNRVVREEYGGAIADESVRDVYSEVAKNYRKYYNTLPSSKTRNHNEINKNYKNLRKGGYPSGVGNDYNFDTADGTSIFIDAANSGEANYGITVIAVDTNGWHKKPNRLGYDVFWYEIRPSGELVPMGRDDTRYPAKDYCSFKSNENYNGAGCTNRAIAEKEYFNKLP